jgi:predicted nucleic acid-binding protein
LSALRAGEGGRRRAIKGTGIDLKNARQVGICIRFDLTLATSNLRHFQRVKDGPAGAV